MARSMFATVQLISDYINKIVEGTDSLSDVNRVVGLSITTELCCNEAQKLTSR